jgi:hypothetical protein
MYLEGLKPQIAVFIIVIKCSETYNGTARNQFLPFPGQEGSVSLRDLEVRILYNPDSRDSKFLS